MKKVFLLALTAIALTACSTPIKKDMSATGGSKADGTVKMAVEHQWFEKVEVDKNQATASATKRCKAWGYKNAEPFEAVSSTCINPGGGLYGACGAWRKTVEYQCLK